MTAAERTAAAALAGDGAVAVAALVQDVHAGIAARPFGILGARAAPVRAVHDAVAGAAYAGVRRGLRALACVAGAVAARAVEEAGAAAQATGPRTAATRAAGPRTAVGQAAARPVAPSASEGARRARAVAVLQGLAPPAAGPFSGAMELRRDGSAVPATRAALRAAFPDARARLVVLVPGLFETERDWQRGGFGAALERTCGVTALHVRYPTGRAVADSGAALAELLDDVVAGWPAPVADVALIGHSMGGLVARVACAAGGAWTERVGLVAGLGTPHFGADVARGLALLARALAVAPETRPFGATVDARSPGIHDLARPTVALSGGVRQASVVAALDDGLLGRVLGDLLVRPASAAGRGPTWRVPGPVRRLDGRTHFDLLHDADVLALLCEWLTQRPGPDGPT